LAVAVSFLSVSGWTLAAQTAEQKQDPPMMEHMMKEGQDGKSHGGMMRIMKMMDQCSRMMESAKADSGEPQQGPKQ
jgi:hypothetical protein